MTKRRDWKSNPYKEVDRIPARSPEPKKEVEKIEAPKKKKRAPKDDPEDV